MFKSKVLIFAAILFMCSAFVFSPLAAQENPTPPSKGGWKFIGGENLENGLLSPIQKTVNGRTVSYVASAPVYFGGNGSNAAWGKAAFSGSQVTYWKAAESLTALNKTVNVERQWEICSGIDIFTINVATVVGSKPSYCERKHEKDSVVKQWLEDWRSCSSGSIYTWYTKSRHRADNLRGIDKTTTNELTVSATCG